MKKPVVLIDAKNLFFRAHYAFKDLSTEDGLSTSVLHGFPLLLLDIQKFAGQADYVVVWDGPPPYPITGQDTRIPLWRRTLYSEYKNNRERNAEAEKAYKQLPALGRFLYILGYLQLGCSGLEADDLLGIGSAFLLNDPDVPHVFIYSNDRDLYQLVGRKISLVAPRGGGGVEEISSHIVEERLGVRPARVPHLKALAGDSSDNYKPVRGLAEKGALKYLAAGVDPSLERWEEHPVTVQEAFTAKLAPHWEMIHTCYLLARIPRSAACTSLPPALQAAAEASLGFLGRNRFRKMSRESLDRRLRSLVRFLMRYELGTLLSRKREFFSGISIRA